MLHYRTGFLPFPNFQGSFKKGGFIMDWQEEYKRKLVPVEDAATQIK